MVLVRPKRRPTTTLRAAEIAGTPDPLPSPTLAISTWSPTDAPRVAMPRRRIFAYGATRVMPRLRAAGPLGRLRLQALADECDLDALEDAIERLLGQERIPVANAAREAAAPDPLPCGTESTRRWDLVLELAHIAGPEVGLQRAQRPGGRSSRLRVPHAPRSDGEIRCPERFSKRKRSW
jgi:hypothetical protein